MGKALGMDDLKVISKLEAEFELPTGNMDTPGVLFNRDAWLGLYSDKPGKLTLGRQGTLTRDFTQNWGNDVEQSELFGGNITYGIFRVNAGYIHYTAQQGVNNSMGDRADNSWATTNIMNAFLSRYLPCHRQLGSRRRSGQWRKVWRGAGP